MNAWYVAKTKPHKEQQVQAFLTKMWGVEVFCPTIRSPGGARARLEPLFPTYAFCLADRESNDWPAVRWAHGINYFLGTGEEIVPVPDTLIAHLRQRVSWWNEGGHATRFASGDRVTVTSGPFSGLEAIFQRYVPARQRCEVLLQVLGRLAKVEIAPEAIADRDPYREMSLSA